MITRRGFVEAFAAFSVLARQTTIAEPADTRYGPLDVEAHRLLQQQGIDLHVIDTATGADLTSRCRFADDTGEGYAIVYRHNAAGAKYFDPVTRQAAIDRIEGIRFRRG